MATVSPPLRLTCLYMGEEILINVFQGCKTARKLGTIQRVIASKDDTPEVNIQILAAKGE